MKPGILVIVAAAAVSLVLLNSCASPAEPVSPPAQPPSIAPADATVEQYLKAPGFEAIDSQGRTVKLSDYIGQKHVVMVINRGFG